MAKHKSAKQPKIIKPTTDNDLILNQLKEIGKDKKKKKNIPNNIKSVSTHTKTKIQNNESIVELFPDVELSIQITTSSILSPNNMLDTSLTLESNETPIPIGVNSILLSTIDKHIRSNYKIRDQLPTILRESLFTKGAYIKAYIPQTSIDDITKKANDSLSVGTGISMEDITNDLFDVSNGFIGDDSNNYSIQTGYSTESIDNINNVITDDSELDIKITDDYNILSMPSISKTIIPKLVKNKLGIETIFDGIVNKNGLNKKTITEDVVTIKTDDENKKDIQSTPLEIKLPVESVIPVIMTNEPENHMGYFVLLDDKGAPITDTSVNSYNGDESIDNIILKDNKTNIISKAKKSLKGITSKAPVLSELEDVYTKILYNKLTNKLENGMFGDMVSIDEKNDLYRTVFNRTLKGLNTKILFIPSELVVYYAFEYRSNGTGKSMLEKVATLFSMRSILLFSKLMANIKNNTTISKVNATIDENDPEPDVTREKIISEILKSTEMKMPIGTTGVNDIVEWIHRMGHVFNIQHPGLPATTIDINETTTSKTVPDDKLDEDIQEYIIMSFGLTKDMVKAGYDPEYATIATANNLLFAKRVMQSQNILTPIITKHIQIILNNDGVIKEKINNIIREHITSIRKKLKSILDDEYKYILNEKNIELLVKYVRIITINNIVAKLPKPEVNESTNLKEAFSDYTDNLDEYLDMLFSSDTLPDDLVGDISDKIESIKSAIKTILVKRWMSDNNYMPELNQFLSLNDDGEPTLNLLDEYNEYVESVVGALLPFIKNNNKNINKYNDKYNKAVSDEEDIDETDDNTEDNLDDTGDDLDDTTDNTENTLDDNNTEGENGDTNNDN